MNRFILDPARKLHLFWVGLILFSFGLVISWFWGWGLRLLGAGIAVFSTWLLLHDVARLGLSQENGQARFRALSLLVGFLWLGFAGQQWALFGEVPAGPRYDAVVHSVFLGFTLSMVFRSCADHLPQPAQAILPFWEKAVPPPGLAACFRGVAGGL